MTIIVTNDKLHAPSRNLRHDAASPKTDATEFDAVFLENWQTVYRVLVRLVGDPAEAEDLALETFWQLYHRPPVNSNGLGGWLYRVAMNLGLNAIRARKRRLRCNLLKITPRHRPTPLLNRSPKLRQWNAHISTPSKRNRRR